VLILFDNGTPRGIARHLSDHTVVEARDCGWEELANGSLIDAAEQAGFAVIVTTDKNIQYQQNLTNRKISLVVLGNSQWPMVKLVLKDIIAAVNAPTPGSFAEVYVPFREGKNH
jgi:glutamate racemase